MSVTKISSSCIPLLMDNVDTDQIIPAKYLSITDKKWLGRHAFGAWRWLDDGKPNPDFILNKETHRGNILLTWENFWCGSSREHAVWALQDYGFDAVIAKWFSDIFYNNCLNNFVVPVKVSETFWAWLVSAQEVDPFVEVTIDVPSQMISYSWWEMIFDLNPFKKECLLSGQGNLEYLMSKRAVIEQWEEKMGK